LIASPYVGRVTGSAGSRAIAKVASLFLAAISVAMIRAGIMGFLHPHP
jgi:multiple antibiotic resistance protein